MSITYPRNFPSTRMSRVIFEAEPMEANSGEQGGRFVSVQLGPALWRAEFGLDPGSEVEFSKWRAWLDSLDGAGREFFAYDMRRPLPWNYRRTGLTDLLRASSLGAFDGTSSAWSIDETGTEITVGDALGQELPAGLDLIVGDYLGLQWGDLRSLHRIVEGAVADVDGIATWTVRPMIEVDVPESAIVNFIKPTCRMAVVERDRSAEHKSRRINFRAVQNLEFESDGGEPSLDFSDDENSQYLPLI